MPSFTRASYSKKSIRADYEASTAHYAQSSQSAEKAKMSLGRAVSSAAAIILGLAFCYAGLHYVPTLLRPTVIVDQVASPSGKSKLDIDRNRLKRWGVFAQSFLLRRTYIRPGQGLTVYYTLPENAALDLHIQQCRRMFIAEVFHCTAVSQQSVTIKETRRGARTLQFTEPGFYHFSETVSGVGPNQDYQIIWTRS